MAKQDDYIKTALRIPKSLHARLTAEAESKGRSLNAEFIACLERGLDSGDANPSAQPAAVELDYDQLVDTLMRKARENDEFISIHATKNVGMIDRKPRIPAVGAMPAPPGALRATAEPTPAAPDKVIDPASTVGKRERLRGTKT